MRLRLETLWAISAAKDWLCLRDEERGEPHARILACPTSSHFPSTPRTART
jgi:hypothetical protein